MKNLFTIIVSVLNTLIQPTTQFILSDATIRPYGSNSTHCIFKRYLSYSHSQELWLWTPCLNSNPKFQWRFDESTGLITSIGSEIKNPGKPFCWWIQHVNRVWTQRVRIKECDETDSGQKFVYLQGTLYLRDHLSLCVGWLPNDGELSKVALTAMKCYVNGFEGESVGENSCEDENEENSNDPTIACKN